MTTDNQQSNGSIAPENANPTQDNATENIDQVQIDAQDENASTKDEAVEQQNIPVISEPVQQHQYTAPVITPSIEKRQNTKRVTTGPDKKSISASGSDRLTITISFSKDDAPHLQKIITERINHKITRDPSHFIKQCVDFAINAGLIEALPEKQRFKPRFAVPDGTQIHYLKDALFNNTIKQ